MLTTSLSILVNVDQYSLLGQKRGIRQGDPISSYIFIIFAGYLGIYSFILNVVKSVPAIQSLKMAQPFDI